MLPPKSFTLPAIVLAYRFLNTSINVGMAGPKITAKRAGKINNAIGMSILMGAFWAISWARNRRSIRICSA
jgi:hypothetical protein